MADAAANFQLSTKEAAAPALTTNYYFQLPTKLLIFAKNVDIK
jgi:hypothetical protein